MSWLARSIANTLKLNDSDDDDKDNSVGNRGNDCAVSEPKSEKDQQSDDPSSPQSPSRGVREDISELTKTLTRQLWGVASFLAPPPQPEPYKPLQDSAAKGKEESISDLEESDPMGIAGLRSDLAEIGGKFKSGISRLSDNIAVAEITKMASNFLQLGGEEELYNSVRGAVGITEEVVAFVKDISMHPETWLDFPLPVEEEDEDFDMTDVQQEHALAVERLAPRLAALRIELCPGYMSEACFWKIYFVLLHPRLDKEDAELLSTPQVVKARTILAQELQDRANMKLKGSGNTIIDPNKIIDPQREESLSVPSSTLGNDPLKTTILETATSNLASDSDMEKCPIGCTEIEIVNKSVIEEGHNKQIKDGNLHSVFVNKVAEQDEDDGDDWLKEANIEEESVNKTTVHMENEEDVSFSDLEEDDGDAPSSFKKVNYSSDKDSRDWVQLRNSTNDSSSDIKSIDIEHVGNKKVNVHSLDTKESSDWLDVDDIDVA